MGYNLAIYIYGLLIRIAALFNEKASLFTTGRKGLFDRLAMDFKPEAKKVAWFHCASLGEFEQGRPVIEKFKAAYPDYLIYLSFYSPSGYEIRKNYEGADYISYLPLDSSGNAKKFIERVRPSVAFFVKYEFWPNYLKELKKKQIPVISFSTIFREDQVFFKWYGGPYRKVLSYVGHFFIQNKSSAQLLDKLGHSNYSLSGDTRFDRVAAIAENPKPLPEIESFTRGEKCLVIGSSWKEDMDILLPLINKQTRPLKYIIVPHEIEEKAISGLQKNLQVSSGRFSQWNDSMQESQVLIIDSIGMLSSIYQFADLAYIGGAFGKGLHNTLEAIIYEIPVIFGNRNYKKFQEANDLISLGAAWPVGDSYELGEKIFGYLDESDLQQKVQKQIREYISSNLGASEEIINFSKKILA